MNNERPDLEGLCYPQEEKILEDDEDYDVEDYEEFFMSDSETGSSELSEDLSGFGLNLLQSDSSYIHGLYFIKFELI